MFAVLAIQTFLCGTVYAAQIVGSVGGEHRPLLAGINLESLALLGLNAIIAAGALFSMFGLPRFPKPGQEVDVRIDVTGLWFGGEAPRIVPWRRVAMISDSGTAFVFHSSPLGTDLLVVPKRVLADGGTALWTFLDHRLVGKYRLIRSPNAPRVIFPPKAP